MFFINTHSLFHACNTSENIGKGACLPFKTPTAEILFMYVDILNHDTITSYQLTSLPVECGV